METIEPAAGLPSPRKQITQSMRLECARSADAIRRAAGCGHMDAMREGLRLSADGERCVQTLARARLRRRRGAGHALLLPAQAAN
eukprot:6180011-Pleurochrysis_carterae.AAC.1